MTVLDAEAVVSSSGNTTLLIVAEGVTPRADMQDEGGWRPGGGRVLLGRRALVTGASSGIGADFARQLAALGCDLVLVARRGERLEALAQELTDAYGHHVRCIALDLTAAGACQQLHAQLCDTPIDVLVNNAGSGAFGPYLDSDWTRVAELIAINVVAPAQLTHLLATDMQKRGFGYILQVASTGSLQPVPLQAAYGAAKSFLLSLSQALDYELRGSGVSCTTLCPGVTDTEFFEVAKQEPTAFQRKVMMDSAVVARIGIRAMLRRRRVVVAGGLNALSMWLINLLPRRLATDIVYRTMR